MCVLSYPSAAAWFSARAQSGVVAEAAAVSGAHAERNAELLRRAASYNDDLRVGARIEPDARVPLGGVAADDYRSQLDDGSTGVMTRLRIPGIGVDLPAYHGTDDETLLRGLGHLEGTSLPVGGSGTHTVLTGHRGLADARMFTDLDRVEAGDRMTLTTFGEVLTYEVTDVVVVDPEDTESLAAVPGRDLLTLVTCTPLGINSQRILVTAERVTPTPPADLSAATATPDGAGFPWWALAVGGGALAGGAYVWWSGLPRRPRSPELP